MTFLARANFLACLKHTFKSTSVVCTGLPGTVEPACVGCINRQTQLSCRTIQKRDQHTPSITGLEDLSAWQRMKWNMGLHGKLQVPNRKLIPAGYNLYICCTDFVDFAEFVKVVNLPDTFYSWFLLLQLHMWLVNVKLSQMGKEGILLKQHFYRALWDNIEKRLLKYEDMLGSERREATENLYSLMLTSILYLDEGLMGSDKTLANALWCQLFSLSPKMEADKLELMVEYVRKQVHHHDQLDPYPIMTPGYISFMPLIGDKLDQKKVEQHIKILRSY